MNSASIVPAEWQGGKRALALADWICRMAHGGVMIGADLWVWVTLDELPRFYTEVVAVESLLARLADLPRGPSGGWGAPGAGAALTRLSMAPWHYVMRSRRASGSPADDLVGYGWTVAAGPTGQALAAWAAELARPAEAGYWERLQARRAAFLKYQATQGPGTGAWLVGF